LKFMNYIQSLLHHPAGPKTIFFWAPLFKWGLVFAGLADLQRPAEHLSVSQSSALALSGIIWSRYSLVIKPKNWSLFGVNVLIAACHKCAIIVNLYFPRHLQTTLRMARNSAERIAVLFVIITIAQALHYQGSYINGYYPYGQAAVLTQGTSSWKNRQNDQTDDHEYDFESDDDDDYMPTRRSRRPSVHQQPVNRRWNQKPPKSITVNPTPDTANTIVEMIVKFRDPISGAPLVPDISVVAAKHDWRPSLSCSSNRCLGCVQKVLEEISISLEPNDRNTFGEIRFLQEELKLYRKDYKPYCTHLNNKASDFYDCTPKPIDEDQVSEFSSYLRGEQLTCTVDKNRKPKPQYGWPDQEYFLKQSGMRSGQSRNGDSMTFTHGTVAEINCAYRRGEPTDSGGGEMALCDMCWSMQVLSPNFTPRYISQITCNAQDRICLSGYGKCKERYRTINVWYKRDNDHMKAAVVNAPVACECFVPYSSSLRNLVVG
ncbi:Mitochondrial pyruvate carrier 2, partial [Trichinella sp. T6]